MPQSLTQKAVNNFVKGLITEAAELTFPDGASVDELNCDLRRDGTRRRRLAVAIEEDADLTFGPVADDDTFHTGSWINVGGDSSKEFLVVQLGYLLYFYNKGARPYSAQRLTGPFTSVDLRTFERPSSLGAETAKCQFASIRGVLVVSSPEINTFTVRYDNTGFVTATQIQFEVRDFQFQDENAENYYTDSGTATPTDARKYDTLNSGWAEENNGRTGTSLAYYKSDTTNNPNGYYPALTHPWFSGKTSDDKFDVAEWKKIGAGTSLAGNGRYVLDFFDKKRNSTNGITAGSGETIGTSLDEAEASRFKTVEAFAGRVFYAGLDSENYSGTILFSKIIDTIYDFGKCYQENDPTSEYLSILLDTDGGEINIPDAVNIQKLYAYQNTLFVFAENGVWQISGVDGAFTASSFFISRVSRVGIHNPESFVAADGIPFWWSRYGIHTLNIDPSGLQATEQNISIPTIQSYWDDISADAKDKAVSTYDAVNKRIYWAYPDAGETVASKLNNFLVLDIPLRAFFPWRVADQDTNTNCIIGVATYSGYGSDILTLNVVSNTANVVTSAGAEVVVQKDAPYNTGDPSLVLICRDGATQNMTMGGFSSTSFLDWGDADYSSYAVTGYDFSGDLVLKKTAPYVVTYNRLTEEGFTGNEDIGYEPVRPSSMLVSVAWDFNSSFSQGQQAYRLKYPVVVDPNNLSVYDYPEDVITSRLKVRGKGRSIRIKYESEAGKDFILLGWGVVVGVNPRF